MALTKKPMKFLETYGGEKYCVEILITFKCQFDFESFVFLIQNLNENNFYTKFSRIGFWWSYVSICLFKSSFAIWKSSRWWILLLGKNENSQIRHLYFITNPNLSVCFTFKSENENVELRITFSLKKWRTFWIEIRNRE